MWFGTKDGLNRYDASEIKIYRFQTGINTNYSNTINDIIETEDGDLLVCTEKGLGVYNRENNTLTHTGLITNKKVYSIKKGHFDNYLLGTNKGLVKYDKKQMNFLKP